MKQIASSKNFIELKLKQGCLKNSDIDSYILYQGKVIEDYPNNVAGVIQYKLRYEATLNLENEEEYYDAIRVLEESKDGILAGTEMDDFEEIDRSKKEKRRMIARFYLALAVLLLGVMVYMSFKG